jgi:hypothetical protein
MTYSVPVSSSLTREDGKAVYGRQLRLLVSHSLFLNNTMTLHEHYKTGWVRGEQDNRRNTQFSEDDLETIWLD